MSNQLVPQSNEPATEQENHSNKNPYVAYLFSPPGVAIIHNATIFGGKPFHSHYSDSDFCQDLINNHFHTTRNILDTNHILGNSCTEIQFNGAWWREVMSPMLGYLLFMSGVWLAQYFADNIVKYAEKNKHSWSLQQASAAINYFYSKIEPDNYVKFFVLCMAISILEDLIGAACVQKINTVEDAVTLANTQAIVSTALPAAAGMLWGFGQAINYAAKKINERKSETVPLLGEFNDAEQGESRSLRPAL